MCCCHCNSWIAGSYLTVIDGENEERSLHCDSTSIERKREQNTNAWAHRPNCRSYSEAKACLWLAPCLHPPAPCRRKYSTNSCLQRLHTPIPDWLTDWDLLRSFFFFCNKEITLKITYNILGCSFRFCKWWALMGLILSGPLCLGLQTEQIEMDFQWNLYISCICYSLGLWRPR